MNFLCASEYKTLNIIPSAGGGKEMFKSLLKDISVLKNRYINPKQDFKVSAVILCYNGENYIEKRLESILQQSFKPYEIIFLDDASADNSVSIANCLLKNKGIKCNIISNNQNVGVGPQLVKGLESAQGDFIWFTEQDDYCSKEFLAKMKGTFEDDDVNISYCRSIPIDQNHIELKHYYKEKSPSHDYCIDGIQEMVNGLCIKNTIYDISSVVFRRTALIGIEKEISKFKVFYDWMLYAYVLQSGKISYCSDALNFHMRHTDSIIAKNRQSSEFYDDLFLVKSYIIDHYTLPKPIMLEMLYEIDRDYRIHGRKSDGCSEIKKHPYLGPKYNKLQNKIKEADKKITVHNIPQYRIKT